MSHAYIDIKYIGMISHGLRNFKWERPNKIARFSCPICGDSATRKHIARGTFMISPEFSSFYCHNCGYKTNLFGFLKILYPTEYREYVFEVFKETGGSVHEDVGLDVDVTEFSEKPKFAEKDYLDGMCQKLSSLPKSHPAVAYVRSRKIQYQDLWFCPDFRQLVYDFEPEYEKGGSKIPEEARLIIPFRDRDGNLSGFQGRSFGKSKLRYITIKKDDADIVFGLDRVDFSKTVLVFEGALDSTFFPNSIALNGSSLGRVDRIFSKSEIDKMIFCLDNEPRNRDIVRIMRKLLESGKRVVIWNKETEKDVNNMILSGMSMIDIVKLIRDSIGEGLTGLLKLSQWQRC